MVRKITRTWLLWDCREHIDKWPLPKNPVTLHVSYRLHKWSSFTWANSITVRIAFISFRYVSPRNGSHLEPNLWLSLTFSAVTAFLESSPQQYESRNTHARQITYSNQAKTKPKIGQHRNWSIGNIIVGPQRPSVLQTFIATTLAYPCSDRCFRPKNPPFASEALFLRNFWGHWKKFSIWPSSSLERFLHAIWLPRNRSSHGLRSFWLEIYAFKKRFSFPCLATGFFPAQPKRCSSDIHLVCHKRKFCKWNSL